MDEAVKRKPDVETVATAGWVPLSGDRWSREGALPEGWTPRPGEPLRLAYNLGTPGYVGSVGIPPTAGRDFTEAEDADAPGVGVVLQSSMDRFWPGLDPLGRGIRLPESDSSLEVAGEGGHVLPVVPELTITYVVWVDTDREYVTPQGGLFTQIRDARLARGGVFPDEADASSRGV
jgi:hypothetical protein